MTVIKPILKYPGAKWALAPWIVQHLPRSMHYVEPFCGSAAVFFNLPWRPRHAVLNDLSGDIVNLFRVIRERGDELAALIEMTPYSRIEYNESMEQAPNHIERARRLLVHIWQSHSADGVRGKGSWSFGPKLSASGDVASRAVLWQNVPQRIRATIEPLRNADIESVPAVELIQRYHRYSDALLYVDPPYPLSTRSGKLYQFEMTDADHILLLDALDLHPGPVVLSGYRCQLYDERLVRWHSVTTQTQAEKGNIRTEVLWLNEKAASSQQLRMAF